MVSVILVARTIIPTNQFQVYDKFYFFSISRDNALFLHIIRVKPLCDSKGVACVQQILLKFLILYKFKGVFKSLNQNFYLCLEPLEEYRTKGRGFVGSSRGKGS